MTDRSARMRRGLALPIALVAVIVVSMFGTLVLDSVLQDLRLARAARAQLRAQGGVESGLAPLLGVAIDSAWLAAPLGSTRQERIATGADSLTVTLTRLGGRLVRASSSARSRLGRSRGDAAEVLFLSILRDSTGVLRLVGVRGWSRVPDP
jgi:hypothetical protein